MGRDLLKTGAAESALVSCGVRLWLVELGVPTTPVSDVVAFPESLRARGAGWMSAGPQTAQQLLFASAGVLPNGSSLGIYTALSRPGVRLGARKINSGARGPGEGRGFRGRTSGVTSRVNSVWWGFRVAVQNTRDDRRGRSRNGGRSGRVETQRKGSGAWFCEFLTGHDLSVPQTAHNRPILAFVWQWGGPPVTSLARPASGKQWRVLRTAAWSHAMRFMARKEAEPKNCLLL